MSTSMLKRCLKARAREISRSLPIAWLVGMVIALVITGTVAVASGGQMTPRMQDGTPVASPRASPAASPMAHDLGPSTQIIVGEITVEIRDNAIVPRHFESALGRDITITAVNTGSEPHNFTVEEFDIDIDLEPGETETVELEDPPLGTFRYYSDLHGDEGLEGTFTVFI